MFKVDKKSLLCTEYVQIVTDHGTLSKLPENRKWVQKETCCVKLVKGSAATSMTLLHCSNRKCLVSGVFSSVSEMCRKILLNVSGSYESNNQHKYFSPSNIDLSKVNDRNTGKRCE